MKAAAVDARGAPIVSDPYIDGRRLAGAGGEAVAIHNPFDNSEICSIAPASIGQVERKQYPVLPPEDQRSV